MAVTQNTYTGNGSTTNYSFTFPYLETTDIKVSVNGTLTTAYTLANATTVSFNTAPVNGAAIRIYRQTDDASLAAQFYPGSAIRSQDLNDNFTQNLYVTQEATNNASTAVASADSATSTANTALATSNTALSTANTALANSTSAVSTSTSANTLATQALATSNAAAADAANALVVSASAEDKADDAVATADASASDTALALSTALSAADDASTALSTANDADATATSAAADAATALATSTTALANSASAVTTATAADVKAESAIAAVSNSISYTLVANVAAIPASPQDNTYIEVSDSTGIQSFTPLTGVPGGYVGDPGLAVRLRYSATSSSWTWLSYYAIDTEGRYANTSGDTFTGRIQGAVTNNLIPFYYQLYSSFPSATTYKGSVAHAEDTGHLYYAHNGSWIPLLNRPTSGVTAGYGLRTNGTEVYWAPVSPTGGGSDTVFNENSTVVTTSYTISSGKNASSAGPISLDAGVVVTVPQYSTWVVI